MVVSWPDSLPKCSFPESRNETYEQAIREFKPDSGPPIRGPKQTDDYKNFGGRYVFSRDQVADFWTFYLTTINRGIDRFTMYDPVARTTHTVEFVNAAPPVFQGMQTPNKLTVELYFRVIA